MRRRHTEDRNFLLENSPIPFGFLRRIENGLTLKNFGLFAFLVQGAGFAVTRQGWGLDPSWTWLTIKAAQQKLFGDGSFFWTHGPLFFLDTQQLFWREGLFISLIFRLGVAVALYFVVYKTLESSKIRNPLTFVLVAVLLSTFIFQYIPPTLILVVIGFLFVLNPQLKPFAKSQIAPYLLGLSLAIELYTKVLYLALMILVVLALILEGKNRFRNAVVTLLSFLTSSVFFALISGFSIRSFFDFLRGSFELTLGYKAMSIEVPFHTYEYLTFSLAVFFLYIVVRGSHLDRYQTILIILVVYLSFNYGFTRHDAHSTFTYFWIFLTACVLSLNNKSLTSWIATSLTGLLFVMASSFSFQGFFDLSPRIQSSTNYLRLLDPRFLGEMKQSEVASVIGQANVPADVIARIGDQGVAVLPWDQLTAYGYGLNLKTPPVPQAYSAYTAWLDRKNSDYFSSQSAPKFILLTQPKAIDGRNFWWESPEAQLAIFCGYEVEVTSQAWLLLRLRDQKLCDFKSEGSINLIVGNKTSLPTDNSNITLVDLEFKQSGLEKLLDLVFKPVYQSKIEVDGKAFNIVTKNTKRLVLSVPEEIDYPGPWSIGTVQTLSGKNLSLIRVIRVSTK